MRERALFWRQLAMLVEQGVPIMAALEVLARQGTETAAAEHILREIHRGKMLSDAMIGHFPPLERWMVRVGERTGGLVSSLRRLADWQERDLELANRSRKAMLYPFFVVVVAGGLTLVLLGTVLPAFIPILTDLHVELPLLTRLVLSLSTACQKVWPLALLGAATAVAVYFLREYAQTEAGGRQLYRLVLEVPVLGTVVESAALARYCEVLAMLLETGTDLLTSLQLAARASNNPLLIEDSGNLAEAVRDGETISSYMATREDLYRVGLTRLLAAGEESHTLRPFLRAAARTLALDSELLLDTLTALLEPILITGVAVVVGTLVLAVLLPIYGSLRGL